MKKKNQTKKKKAKRDIVLWRLFFEKLLQNIDASVVVTDNKGHIVFANKMFVDYFRFSRKNIIGKYWMPEIMPGTRQRDAQRIFDTIKQMKTLARFDTPVLTDGKREKYFCWTSIPLKEKRRMFFMFIGREKKCRAGSALKIRAYNAKNLNASYREVIDAIFAASKISEPSTARHANRVMSFVVPLARKLKIRKEKIEILKIASLLHDLGKLAVDKKILFKKGKLNKKEFDEVKKHPHWGAEAVHLVYFLHDIVPIMADHHEDYDGTGYPVGMKGNDIPLEARILSVADIYEALTADRPYRKAFSKREAIAIMENEKGHKLDPQITDIFLDMIKKGKIKDA